MPEPSRRPPVTARHLQRLTFDILQRSPTDAERAAFLGADLAVVVPRLLGTREAATAWLEEELWYFLLIDQFRPRGEAIERLPARLHKRELTARDAIAEILLSTGFTLRNPGNDTFVTVLLEQTLGYRVQDKKHQPTLVAGKKVYDGARERFLGELAQNQSDLIQIALRHQDAARHLLGRHHRRLFDALLGKDASEVAALHADPTRFFAIVGDWLVGERYQQALAQRRRKSERQFLRGLYQDLLGRLPDYDELRQTRAAMQSMADPTPLRAVLAKVLLDSQHARLPEHDGDAAAFVQRCFLRYLAREPNAREQQAFTTAMAQGKPAQIARALVTSLEYQTY
ncbi:MAG: hypothetical protein IPK26_23835 [Planctomycetes bacterium]|nr:hypothetical protein [Planctomycetota bacterium]